MYNFWSFLYKNRKNGLSLVMTTFLSYFILKPVYVSLSMRHVIAIKIASGHDHLTSSSTV